MSNKDAVRRLIEELWHKGNLAVLDEYYTPEYVHHDPNAPDVHDLPGFRKWATGVRTAFPDHHVEVEGTCEEAGTMVVRWTATGTHKGTFEGISATGKQFAFTGMTMHRFKNGKIAESWWAYDAVGLMRQLGLIPPALAA